MKARITASDGEVFHLAWTGGRVVADSDVPIAARCAAYLNGTPTLYLGEPNDGGTDGHYTEMRRLASEEEFLLTVGSLFDRFHVRVDLVGELSRADHNEILTNPDANAAISEQAIERAIRQGMSEDEARRLYGLDRQ